MGVLNLEQNIESVENLGETKLGWQEGGTKRGRARIGMGTTIWRGDGKSYNLDTLEG